MKNICDSLYDHVIIGLGSFQLQYYRPILILPTCHWPKSIGCDGVTNVSSEITSGIEFYSTTSLHFIYGLLMNEGSSLWTWWKMENSIQPRTRDIVCLISYVMGCNFIWKQISGGIPWIKEYSRLHKQFFITTCYIRISATRKTTV